MTSAAMSLENFPSRPSSSATQRWAGILFVACSGLLLMLGFVQTKTSLSGSELRRMWASRNSDEHPRAEMGDLEDFAEYTVQIRRGAGWSAGLKRVFLDLNRYLKDDVVAESMSARRYHLTRRQVELNKDLSRFVVIGFLKRYTSICCHLFELMDIDKVGHVSPEDMIKSMRRGLDVITTMTGWSRHAGNSDIFFEKKETLEDLAEDLRGLTYDTRLLYSLLNDYLKMYIDGNDYGSMSESREVPKKEQEHVDRLLSLSYGELQFLGMYSVIVIRLLEEMNARKDTRKILNNNEDMIKMIQHALNSLKL